MFWLILQTLLLAAIAYILGCLCGCWLKGIFGADSGAATATAVAVPAAAAASVATASEPAAPIAAPAPIPTPAPAPQADPTPAPAPEPEAPVAADPEPAVQPLMAAAPAAKPKPKAKAKAKPRAKATSRAKTVKAAPVVPAVPDDLKRIRGIGRQNEARLNAIDITTFAQIAGWTKKQQAEIGEKLAFPGRIEREEWVAQAKVLAKGKETEFSKRVAKGEVSTSAGKGDVGLVGKKPRVLKAARRGKPDNLTLIDGVGNAIEQKLFALGLFHFDQIAKLSDAEATWVGNEIGFPGRVQRENWVAESRILAEGGMTEHAAKVEAGKIKTSRASKTTEKGNKK